jgi:Bacterial TniB protein
MVVQAPPVPDECRFYSAILEDIFEPKRPHDSAANQQIHVVRALRRIGLRMLLIDELHHVLAGPTAKQRQFLNVLKYLGNELEIPIVGVGTKDAVRAVQTDPQLANRFQPVALPPWEMNRDFLMLLASLERMIPLKRPSNLIQPALANRLFALSEGTIGELVALLSSAAVYAVRTEKERVDEEVLAALDWTPPSLRRRRAEQVL